MGRGLKIDISYRKLRSNVKVIKNPTATLKGAEESVTTSYQINFFERRIRQVLIQKFIIIEILLQILSFY